MSIEEQLRDALEESQRLGFLGDRPIPEVVDHAGAFLTALVGVRGSVVDLGSGGGVPGLILAVRRPDLELTLVDRRTKRTDFLSRIVARLDLTARVTVRAVDVATLRREAAGAFDAAVARGFGPPLSTLEAGLELVRTHGRVVISEPPEGDRWDADAVRRLGSERVTGPAGVAVFERR